MYFMGNIDADEPGVGKESLCMLGLGKEMREIGNEVEEVEREEKALSQKKCGSSRSVFIEVVLSPPPGSLPTQLGSR